MPARLIKPLLLFLLVLWPSAQAATVTHHHGGTSAGRIGEVHETGFQFFGELFLFLEFTQVSDIRVDPKLTGSALSRETELVRKISLLLNKQTHPASLLKRQVVAWLEEKRYEELDRKADQINQTNARWASGRWQIYTFYQAITQGLSSGDISEHKQRVKLVKDWVLQKPDSVAAKISLMKALTRLAWTYRGSGYNNTVSAEGRKRFKEYLKEAIDLGERVKARQPTDLMLFEALIWAGNGFGLEKNYLIDLSKESSRVNPEFYLPYAATLESLLPKWGGRPGEAEKFGRWANGLVSKSSPEVIFQTHRAFKQSISDRKYGRMNFDWPRIKRGFENFSQRYHVNDRDLHLMAKLAALNGDRTGAVDYFARSDGSWNYLSKGIWGKKGRLEQFVTWAETKPTPGYERAIQAILQENFPVFSELTRRVVADGDLYSAKDVYGETVLHAVSRSHSPKFLEFIAARGVDLEIRNAYGDTALHIAVRAERLANVEILLAHGADAFSTPVDDKDTAAHIAAGQGFTEVLALLLANEPKLKETKGDNGSFPLHIAARKGHIDTVEFMLSQGTTELDAQDDYSYTPLHYAVEREDEAIVRLLVETGADTSLKNRRGNTPLSFARASEFNHIAEYLASVGALDVPVVERPANYKKAKDLYQQAAAYYNQADFNQAIELYRAAIELYPEFHLAYFSLASIAINFEKDYAKADDYLDRSIALKPEYVENYYWKGRVNYELGKPEIYRPLFAKYIKLAPDTYNTKDLLTNWSHLLPDQDEPTAKPANFLYRYWELIALVFAVLFGLLVLGRRAR